MYKHTEKWRVAWSLPPFFWRELLWGFFFFWTVVNKRKEKYMDIYLYTEITHWVFSVWCISSYIEIHRVSVYTHPFTHTHTLTYSMWIQMSWVSLGVHWSLCITKWWWNTWFVFYSWEDSRREWQFWCTLEWHSHVNTCILKTSELIQSF